LWVCPVAGVRTRISAHLRHEDYLRQPVGSPYGLREMLDVAARHGVKATTELFPMSKANEAIEKVKRTKCATGLSSPTKGQLLVS